VSAEDLAKQAAERVREVVSEAERRAEEIVQAAKNEAAEIKQRAEAEARETREKLERARQALSDLTAETPEPPVPGPDPTPPGPDPQPPTPSPDPGPPGPPDPGPQISAGNSSGGDDAAARLVAMKLAVDGRGRDEIQRELEERFGGADPSLIDDVLARAGK
jgi:hypothetical protein